MQINLVYKKYIYSTEKCNIFYIAESSTKETVKQFKLSRF